MMMAKVWDVVCGMDVDPETSCSAEYQGKTFYFCCNGCRGAFQRTPDVHLQMWAEDHPGVDPSPPQDAGEADVAEVGEDEYDPND